MATVIYPMIHRLKPLKKRVYRVMFPANILDELFELEKARTQKQYENLYLPFYSLKKMLNNYLFLSDAGIIKSVCNRNKDSEWIISLEKPDMKLLSETFKLWMEAFYICEILGKKTDEETKERARKIISEITPDIFP